MNTVRVSVPLVIFTATIATGLLVAADSGANAGETGTSAATVRNDFSNATLNDRYGFHTLAFRGAVPFAISGFYRFDGNGGLTGRDVVSDTEAPPVVVHREYRGTYEVRPNGTGILTLDIAPEFQPQGHFTIVDGGKAIEIVFAVEGNANAFTLRKQNTD